MIKGKSPKIFVLAFVISLILTANSALVSAAIMETEPNDTLETANQYTLGEIFVGIITSEKDADFLEFTTGYDETLNILLLPQSTETADVDWWLWDMTDNELLFQQNSINPGQYERFSFDGKSGHWYVVAIAANKGMDKYYQFSVSR